MLKKRFLLCILFIFFCLSIIFSSSTYAADPSTLKISSPSVLVIERKTGNVIYAKNADTTRYPASLTKIMTAIVVIENSNLSDVIKMTYDEVSKVPSGYSNAGLKVDEELTVDQLLHLLLLCSASDAAYALADHVGGSIPNFVTMMNAKAKELGCANTNFVSPDGVQNAKHITTATDLAKIANYAMNNETFRGIVSKSSYILYPTNKTSTERLYKNSNSLLDKTSTYYYSKAIGVKTGFTTPAGNCLVACAKQDDNDLEFIVVILGATQTSSGLSERFLDAKTLFDYAFGNYTYSDVEKANDVVTTTTIKGATNKTKNLELKLESNITAFIDKKELASGAYFQPNISLNEDLKAPIENGTVVGTATYTVDGVNYTSNLLAAKDVKKSYTAVIVTVVIIFIALVAVYVYIDNQKNRKKKNHRIDRLVGQYRSPENLE